MAIQAGAFIYAADHNVTRQVYTPQLLASSTNPTLGSGAVQNGRYIRDPISGLVYCQFVIQFGTSGTNAGSGDYIITLPTTVDSFHPTGQLGRAEVWGHGTIRDHDNADATRDVTITRDTATGGPGGVGTATLTLSMLSIGTTATRVAHNEPWSWSANDTMTGFLVYLSPVA